MNAALLSNDYFCWMFKVFSNESDAVNYIGSIGDNWFGPNSTPAPGEQWNYFLRGTVFDKVNFNDLSTYLQAH